MAVKLHLGSGGVRIPGYLNVDLRPGPDVDYVENVGTLGSFRSNSVESIYACHVLEHFSHEMGNITATCTSVIKRWYDLLIPGGVLYVAVPNLDQILKQILKGKKYKQTLGYFMAVYGGQDYVENTHYCGFTKKTLVDLLKMNGFCCPVEFNPWVNDTTTFKINETKMSLNIKCFKFSKNTSAIEKIKWYSNALIGKNE